MIALIRNLSLVVVANEAIVRKWLVSTLEAMGARVQHACCGWDLQRLRTAAARLGAGLVSGPLSAGELARQVRRTSPSARIGGPPTTVH